MYLGQPQTNTSKHLHTWSASHTDEYWKKNLQSWALEQILNLGYPIKKYGVGGLKI